MKHTRAKGSTAEEHSHLTIAIEQYEASVSAQVNHYAYEPQYAWQSLDEEPVYKFSNGLIVTSNVISPDNRAGDRCVLTLYGDSSSARDLSAKLEDIAELDEYRNPIFRKYRGREVPVYKPPKGLGVIDKARGEMEWRTSLFVANAFVDRWLTILGFASEVFVSLHECRIGRTRWVRGIELRTKNPEEE